MQMKEFMKKYIQNSSSAHHDDGRGPLESYPKLLNPYIEYLTNSWRFKIGNTLLSCPIAALVSTHEF